MGSPEGEKYFNDCAKLKKSLDDEQPANRNLEKLLSETPKMDFQNWFNKHLSISPHNAN